MKKKTTTLTGEKNINNGSPEKNIDHTKETNNQKSRTDNNLKKKKEQSEGMLKAIPLALLALSIFIALCFITEDTGAFGAFISVFLKGCFSYMAYTIPLFIIIHAIFYKSDVKSKRILSRLFFTVISLITLAEIAYIIPNFNLEPVFDPSAFYRDGTQGIGGGFVGGVVSYALIKVFGKVGLIVIMALTVAIYATFFFSGKASLLRRAILKRLSKAANVAADAERERQAKKEKQERERQEKEAEEFAKKHETFADDDFFSTDNGVSRLEIRELGILEEKAGAKVEAGYNLKDNVSKDNHDAQGFTDGGQKPRRGFSDFSSTINLGGRSFERSAEGGKYKSDSIVYDEVKSENNLDDISNPYSVEESADNVFGKSFDPFDLAMNESRAAKRSTRYTATETKKENVYNEDISEISPEQIERARRLEAFEKAKQAAIARARAEAQQEKAAEAAGETPSEPNADPAEDYFTSHLKTEAEESKAAREKTEADVYESLRLKYNSQKMSEDAFLADTAEDEESQRMTEESEERISREIRRELEEKFEAERIEAERRRAEAERMEAERRRAEAERIEAERRRAEAERMEAERRRAEAERMEAERRRAEAERMEAERRRIEAERLETERLKAEAEKIEEERRRIEAEIIEAEKRRIEAELLALRNKEKETLVFDSEESEDESEDESESCDVFEYGKINDKDDLSKISVSRSMLSPEPDTDETDGDETDGESEIISEDDSYEDGAEEYVEKTEIPEEEQNPIINQQRAMFDIFKNESSEDDTDPHSEYEANDTALTVSEDDDYIPEDEDEEPPFEADEPEEVIRKAPDFKDYKLPSIELLQKGVEENVELINREVQDGAEKIINTLASFNITAVMRGIERGPRITRYSIVPAKGIRVNQIEKLSDDICLALEAETIRIEAPIPGKAAVGIEVPNKIASNVYLRDLIDNDEFINSPSKTQVCLGKGVEGGLVYADISSMPHVLIAGATGMGKSVCINSLITSMLYKARPDEVKFIMIDPKKVEFAPYNGIPHLLVPVVTEVKRAAGALMWAVDEMNKRYDVIEKLCVKNIDSYNRKVAEKPELGSPMSKIIIFIDELNDLMIQVRDPVENLITLIAQKARAAGIHLVIGTQRPSVDVITGVIKANIPSRISCKVTSNTDSKTILGLVGAEKLIGKGDMLFSNEGRPLKRVQGAYVSENETQAIVDFIKAQVNGDLYDEVAMEEMRKASQKCGKSKNEVEEEEDEDSGEGMLHDRKFLAAVEIAIKNGSVATSFLQRKLRIGYSKAALYIDTMEGFGIVSEKDGTKPRDVLCSLADWHEKLARLTSIDD